MSVILKTKTELSILNTYPIVFKYQRLSLNLHTHLYCCAEQIGPIIF